VEKEQVMVNIKSGTDESSAAVGGQTRVADPTSYIADPGPLGLAGFAMTTFVLSIFNAGLVTAPGLVAVVLPLALFYGGLAQFAAGLWEFRKGNTFGALAFCSFGAFWLSFATYVKYVEPGLGANAHIATGIFLLGWAIFTGYMCIAAARIDGVLLGVFVFLTLTFVALTIGTWSQTKAVIGLGGWLGLITAALAWYGSCAGVANFTWKRTLLPVFPLGPAQH
jgi:succinate-acetate transporter protein